MCTYVHIEPSRILFYVSYRLLVAQPAALQRSLHSIAQKKAPDNAVAFELLVG
jgi:hypothetical protein